MAKQPRETTTTTEQTAKPQTITIKADHRGEFIAPCDINPGDELVLELPAARSGLDQVIAEMQPRKAGDKSYCPTRVDVDLSPQQGEALKSLHEALIRRQAQLRSGRFVDPNYPVSAVRWLLEQLVPA